LLESKDVLKRNMDIFIYTIVEECPSEHEWNDEVAICMKDEI
jgi:hypothetical protein